MIENGNIKKFADVVQFCPKNAIYEPLGMSHPTFENRLNHPGSWNMKEFFMLAGILDCDPTKLIKVFEPDEVEKINLQKES